MTMDFLRLPVIAVIGMAFYGEALEPAVALGAALIVAANWLNLRKG
jgi:drug/metabolite transporter (DMT)-like permease